MGCGERGGISWWDRSASTLKALLSFVRARRYGVGRPRRRRRGVCLERRCTHDRRWMRRPRQLRRQRPYVRGVVPEHGRGRKRGEGDLMGRSPAQTLKALPPPPQGRVGAGGHPVCRASAILVRSPSSCVPRSHPSSSNLRLYLPACGRRHRPTRTNRSDPWTEPNLFAFSLTTETRNQPIQKPTYTNALCPVMPRPTIRAFISREPS